MATAITDDRCIMSPTQDEFCHCPHCDRRTRHSVVRERVLAPVLWCLSCYRMHLEGKESAPPVKLKLKKAPHRPLARPLAQLNG
ncbi:hypothetical protein MCP1_180086 [Candidatus Terasakiella magnetica]|nr:hypothetical protein MCP1_180086 [Candidatus Terasakiella magnetica]